MSAARVCTSVGGGGAWLLSLCREPREWGGPCGTSWGLSVRPRSVRASSTVPFFLCLRTRTVDFWGKDMQSYSRSLARVGSGPCTESCQEPWQVPSLHAGIQHRRRAGPPHELPGQLSEGLHADQPRAAQSLLQTHVRVRHVYQLHAGAPPRRPPTPTCQPGLGCFPEPFLGAWRSLSHGRCLFQL